MDDKDWAGRTNELIGRLCWFREPPLTRAIVRAEATNLCSNGMLESTLRVLGSAAHMPECQLEPGRIIDVSKRPRSEFVGCGRLYPLEATDLDAAMREVMADEPPEDFDWMG